MSQTTTDSEHFQYLLHRCVVSDFTGEPANELANFILERCRNNLASGRYALVQQQDKDDIAQDTTVDLIRHLNKDRNQVIDKPMAYISSTTHRHFISHIRRKKQEPKQFPSKPEDRTCFEFNIPETRISDPAIFCYASPVATAGLFTEQETEMLDNLIDISGVSSKKHYELKH
jgi:DNA-directed RNA polymerase specialized sigma24 family protein